MNIPFAFNLWQHTTDIARQYQVGLWGQAHFNLIDRYYACLAQLGQKAVTVIAAEMPWSGQRGYRDPGYPSYLFEHALVAVAGERMKGEDAIRISQVLDTVTWMWRRQMGPRPGDRIFGLINIWVDEEYGFGKVVPRCAGRRYGCAV